MRTLLCTLLLISAYLAGNAQSLLRQTDALVRAAIKKQTSLQSFRPSVLRIKDPEIIHLSASAFIIQTQYKGETQLWGITAAHYDLETPFIVSGRHRIPVTVVAQSNSDAGDVTLFKLPYKTLTNLKPLTLAEEPVQVGQSLHSLGYFNGSWHHENNRTVQEVSPLRIITSLKIPNAHRKYREGACGGPVLNDRNEVVGLHVGSSAFFQIGYVVPVQHIRDLINAYHQNGQSLKSLLFNGHEIGSINVTESISSVWIKKDGKTLGKFSLWHQEKKIDYEHLETLVPRDNFPDADEVVFVISQHPFSPTSVSKKSRLFLLSYHLKNGKINKTPVSIFP